jgi:hypothetical protein
MKYRFKRDVPTLQEVLDARPNAVYLANSVRFVPDPAAPIQGVVVLAHWVAREVADLEELLEAHPAKAVRVALLDDCLTPDAVASKVPGLYEDIQSTPLAAIYTYGSLYSVLRNDPIATLSRWLEDE